MNKKQEKRLFGIFSENIFGTRVLHSSGFVENEKNFGVPKDFSHDSKMEVSSTTRVKCSSRLLCGMRYY